MAGRVSVHVAIDEAFHFVDHRRHEDCSGIRDRPAQPAGRRVECSERAGVVAGERDLPSERERPWS